MQHGPTTLRRLVALYGLLWASACSSPATPHADAGIDASTLDVPTSTGDVPTTPRPDGSTGDVLVQGASCKRGVAYNHENAADLPALSQGLGWWYNWSATPDPTAEAAFAAAGIEFVPMVWSGPPTRTIDVPTLIRTIPAGSRFLLGFNEPNFNSQANLTPAQAAAAWPQLEQIAQARGLQLVSPAVNYCGGACNETDPYVWLDQFFAACVGCQVDYVAFHWYACTQAALQDKLSEFETRYHRPVWLTEFSCLDSSPHDAPVQEAYMNTVVPLLEADPQVFRYAWFIGRGNPGSDPYDLFGAPGALTPLGQEYVGFAGRCAP